MTTQTYMYTCTCTLHCIHYTHPSLCALQHVHMYVHVCTLPPIPEPVCSVIDSWGRGTVPQISGATEEDTSTHPPLGTSSAEYEVQCTVSTCTCTMYVHANQPKTAIYMYHLLVRSSAHLVSCTCMYVCLQESLLSRGEVSTPNSLPPRSKSRYAISFRTCTCTCTQRFIHVHMHMCTCIFLQYTHFLWQRDTRTRKH